MKINAAIINVTNHPSALIPITDRCKAEININEIISSSLITTIYALRTNNSGATFILILSTKSMIYSLKG